MLMQTLHVGAVVHLSASPRRTRVPPLGPAGSLHWICQLGGEISILQLTLQPTFISRCVCKLINIFFPLTPALSLSFSLSLSLSPPFRQIFVSSEVSVGKPSSQLHMLPAANQAGWNPETNRNPPPPPSSFPLSPLLLVQQKLKNLWKGRGEDVFVGGGGC